MATTRATVQLTSDLLSDALSVNTSTTCMKAGTTADGLDQMRMGFNKVPTGTSFDLLDATDIEGISQEPVDAVLTPDPILGVTTITISVGQSTQESELDELAVIAHSACLVKEMSLSLDRQSSGIRNKAAMRKDSDFPN